MKINKSPKLEPILELQSRAAPSVEAHHHVSSPNTGRNSGGRQIIKKLKNLRLDQKDVK